MNAAGSARKEGGEGPTWAEEGLHHGEVGEETAATKAETGGESAEEPSGVLDLCAAHGRGAPEAVRAHEAAARVHQEVGHGLPPVHQVRASVRCVVHRFFGCVWNHPAEAILLQSDVASWKG